MSERQRLKLRWEVASRSGVPFGAWATAGVFRAELCRIRLAEGLWELSVCFGQHSDPVVFRLNAPDFDAARLAAEEYLREILTDALAALGGEGE